MSGSPVTGFILPIADHVFRRYILTVVLLAASLLRYNVFSLTYLIMFLVGVVIPGPRLKAKKTGCMVYLISVLTISTLFFLAQVFFQISLLTGPTLRYCDTLEVILRQIGLIQYTAPTLDVVRYLLPDVLVVIVSSVCVGVAVRVSALHDKPKTESLEVSGSSSSGDPPITHHPADSDEAKLVTLTLLGEGVTSAQSYFKLPKYLLVVMDILIFFLFWLSGVAVPSLTSVWYFLVFLSLALMWSIHFSEIQSISRILKFVSLIYSAVHILALYLYQFQSFQLDAPTIPIHRSSSLVVRLFGLTPLVETTCSNPTMLSFWSEVPLSYVINPWALLALYWMLGTDSQLWLSTPEPFWSLHHTYCTPKLLSPKDLLKIKQRDHSNIQRYGSTDRRSFTEQELEEEDKQEEALTASAGLADSEVYYHSKWYITFINFGQKLTERVVDLWELLMSVNYVFSIVGMMVWSVLYPSWPALVLLLWAVAIWVVPRITPKQSLYYSSPLLVLYAVCLLVLAYLNALPVNYEGFIWGYSVGIECKHSTSHPWGCLSEVLGGKCLLALVFFASLHEQIKEVKERHRHNHQDPDSSTSTASSILYSKLQQVLTTYWIVAVLGSFLLVILVGDPSALKSVYLLALFIFLLVYQLFCKWWMYVSYPLWWVLMVYAALHLVMVYTFQFDVIHDLWYKAYNHSDFLGNFTANDVFHSIGFEPDTEDLSLALFNLLVPPAVFIAVIALQVRYFTPYHLPSSSPWEDQKMLTISQVLSILTQIIAHREVQFEDIEQELVKKDEEELTGRERPILSSFEDELEESDLIEMSLEEAKDRDDKVVEWSKSSSSSTIKTFYHLIVYTLIKLRQTVLLLWHLFWRFCEIHTSKLIIIALFAYGLYELSASYFFVILCAVVIAALPFLNPFVYPLLTIYLGTLSLAKFLFQLPVVPVFTVRKDCNTSSINNTEDIPGTVYNYTFSPQSSDSSWIGLNQTRHSADYVGPLIGIALLICLWYSSQRHQTQFYSSNNIVPKPWEVRSLFLGVDVTQIHQSSIATFKFLVNHFFDLFGIEICFIFEAFLLAARIDVYGIVYAVILGLMLITPRTLLPPVWVLYLLLHGLSLMLQYASLVGLPPSLICQVDGYPWDSVFSGNIRRIERWLYIPHTGADTLDKYLLYVDLVTYLMICFQMRNFLLNPLSVLNENNAFPSIPDIYRTKYWFNFIKILLFQYSFLVALFVLFAAAATRLSIFGLLYLLLCFLFLYREQSLLTDSRKTRVKWWSVLRMTIWAVLFLRSILQLVSCAFVDSIHSSHNRNCWVVSLFNVRCARSSYYGIAKSQECSNGSESAVGFWFDIIAFACVTFQIIIMDTQYAEHVRNNIIRKEEEAQKFARVRNQLMEERKENVRAKEEKDLRELRERAEHLKLTEGKIDHFLYGGVRVPPEYLSTPKHEIDVQIQSPKKVSLEEDKSKNKTGAEEEKPEDSTVDVAEQKIETSLLKTWLMFFYNLWLDFFGMVMEWLESDSADFQLAVYRLKQAHCQSGEDTLLGMVPAIKEEEEVSTPVGSQGQSSSHPPESDRSQLLPEDDEDEPEVKSKQPESSRTKKWEGSEDVLIDILEPNESDEQQALELDTKLGEFTKKHLKPPKRFLFALYCWSLSHFEYIVFLFVIIAIITTGAFTSFIYAVLLFLWGLLSLPIPTKRFWQGLIFYTMVVMIMKYIYSYFLLNLLTENLSDQLNKFAMGQTDLNSVLAWMFGVETEKSYFVNGVVNLLLLMVLMIQRGLLKQYGMWTHSPLDQKLSENILKWIYRNLKQFYKQLLISSTSVAGRKDYYTAMLLCDVLCFLTIVFGYAYFSVTPSTTDEFTQVADYIQSSTVPVPFLIMLFLQFISMLVDRAIYIRHSVMAKLIFYIFLLIGWHVWLLIIVPAITYRAFVDNPAAQLIYFFKSGYFVLSALQITSGYPNKLLGYFFSSSYSISSGILFRCYRMIPIIPTLREVIDWVFTDTSLTLLHWLRVKELWAQIYKVKVRRVWENKYPHNLGEKQSIFSKFIIGGSLLVLLVLLIWGPLVVMSFINQTSKPNPPASASVSLSLEGSRLLEIQAQNPFVYPLTSEQYGKLERKVTSKSVRKEFGSLFRPEDFRRILFPGNSSVLWTASPTTKEQLRTVLSLNPSATLTFSWSLFRLSGGTADETATGSYKTNITEETIKLFIENLAPGSSKNKSSIFLKGLYPIIVYAPKNGDSTDFKQLSQYFHNSKFNGTANLNTTIAYTLPSPNSTSDEAEETIINQWWTLKPANDALLPRSDQESGDALEMIVYSERVSPSIFSYVANLGIIGLYISVVLVIGKFISTYVSTLPQELMIDQIAKPDPLLKLFDDIFTVRQLKMLVLEEILVGKLYFIFRSSTELVSLTDHDKLKKRKTD